jgi:hypothetical protein
MFPRVVNRARAHMALALSYRSGACRTTIGESVIAGIRLYYFERGTGLPIVFLHDNATMLQDFY